MHFYALKQSHGRAQEPASGPLGAIRRSVYGNRGVPPARGAAGAPPPDGPLEAPEGHPRWDGARRWSGAWHYGHEAASGFQQASDQHPAALTVGSVRYRQDDGIGGFGSLKGREFQVVFLPQQAAVGFGIVQVYVDPQILELAHDIDHTSVAPSAGSRRRMRRAYSRVRNVLLQHSEMNSTLKYHFGEFRPLRELVEQVVLRNEKGYKGVAYGLTDLGNGRWKWIFCPKKEDGPPQHGEATGTREHAEMACMSAINAWLTSESK